MQQTCQTLESGLAHAAGERAQVGQKAQASVEDVQSKLFERLDDIIGQRYLITRCRRQIAGGPGIEVDFARGEGGRGFTVCQIQAGGLVAGPQVRARPVVRTEIIAPLLALVVLVICTGGRHRLSRERAARGRGAPALASEAHL